MTTSIYEPNYSSFDHTRSDTHRSLWWIVTVSIAIMIVNVIIAIAIVIIIIIIIIIIVS